MTEPIWSTGGACGERAVTEDLEWAVTALRAAVDDVGAAQLELARRRAAFEVEIGAGLSPGVGHAAALAELTHAALTRAPALQERLDDVARRLHAVAVAYLDAEVKARYRIGVLDRVTEGARDLWGSAVWLVRLAAATELAAVGGGPLMTQPGPRDLLGALAPKGKPPTTALIDRGAAEGLARTVTAAQWRFTLGLALFLLEHIALEPWEGTLRAHPWRATPTESVEDALRRVRATELSRGGAVRIERWRGDDGVLRRIVFIPGTEDWGFWDPNPSDTDADIWLLLGKLPDAAHVVDAALEADGAKPGEPVMLVGHSLGGIVATALASNAEFRDRFTVRAVVTAGSPTGTIHLPRTVRALHLEGTRDLVPGLDGRSNPDTPSRVTVHHDARASQVKELNGAGETIGSAHSLDTYAQTARLVDEGLNASTDAWLEAESDFLEPGRDVVVTEYRPGDQG